MTNLLTKRYLSVVAAVALFLSPIGAGAVAVTWDYSSQVLKPLTAVLGSRTSVGTTTATTNATLTVSATSTDTTAVLSLLKSTGASIFSALASGNIGIGNAAPTYGLDVTGNSHFTSFVDAANFVATSTTATSTFAGSIRVPIGAEGSPSIAFGAEANTGFHLQGTGVIDVNVPNQFRVDVNGSSAIYDFQSTQFLPSPNSSNKLGAFGNSWNGLFASSTSYIDTIIAAGTIRLPALATPAGTLLAVNGSGTIIATSTTSGVTAVTATWPVISSGGTTPNITWGGIATSSQLTATSGFFYSTGVNTFASVATTTGNISIFGLSTTNATTTGTLAVPVGSGVVTPIAGNVAIDTTSGQFRYSDVTGTSRVLVGNQYPGFTYSTSTAWTGTTTQPLGTARVGETWNDVQCFSDVGTLNVSFYDGTNRMNLFNASTTVGTVTLSSNNTFTAGEKRYVDIGTPATAPTKISCTVSKSVTSD